MTKSYPIDGIFLTKMTTMKSICQKSIRVTLVQTLNIWLLYSFYPTERRLKKEGEYPRHQVRPRMSLARCVHSPGDFFATNWGKMWRKVIFYVLIPKRSFIAQMFVLAGHSFALCSFGCLFFSRLFVFRATKSLVVYPCLADSVYFINRYAVEKCWYIALKLQRY